MRKHFVLALLLIVSSIAMAQNAMFTFSVQLTSSDSIDTQKWLNEELTQNKENELAQKYTNLISPTLRQYVSTTEFSEQELLQTMQNNFNNEYKDNYWSFGWNAWKYSSLFHKNVTTKTFRDFLFNKACDILCELIAYYPKDYKTHLVSAFTDALKMLNDVPNHKYEIKDSNPNDQWDDLVIFKDGVMQREMGYGIKGFLLRRIYMDNIPYTEIKEKAITLLNKIKAVDNSKNLSVLAHYTINNDIAYCIASESNYFISLASKKKFYPYNNAYLKAYYPNIIKYRFNAGQSFYVISNLQWCSEKGTTIIDKNADVIYSEK